MTRRAVRWLMMAAVAAVAAMATCTHHPRSFTSDQWPRQTQPKAGMISLAEARRAVPASPMVFVAWEGINPRPRGAKGRTIWTWRGRDAEGREWRVENVRRADGVNLKTRLEACE